jgi:hypothetical protein
VRSGFRDTDTCHLGPRAAAHAARASPLHGSRCSTWNTSAPARLPCAHRLRGRYGGSRLFHVERPGPTPSRLSISWGTHGTGRPLRWKDEVSAPGGWAALRTDLVWTGPLMPTDLAHPQSNLESDAGRQCHRHWATYADVMRTGRAQNLCSSVIREFCAAHEPNARNHTRDPAEAMWMQHAQGPNSPAMRVMRMDHAQGLCAWLVRITGPAPPHAPPVWIRVGMGAHSKAC